MGTWDQSPAGNDVAADWLSELFGNFSEGILTTLDEHQDAEPEEVRVAAWLVNVLSREKAWPLDTLSPALEAAIAGLERLLQDEDTRRDIGMELEGELNELRERRRSL